MEIIAIIIYVLCVVLNLYTLIQSIGVKNKPLIIITSLSLCWCLYSTIFLFDIINN